MTRPLSPTIFAIAMRAKPIPQPTSITVMPGLNVGADDLLRVVEKPPQRVVDEVAAPPGANVRHNGPPPEMLPCYHHFIGCFSKNSQIKSLAEMFLVDLPMKSTGGCWPGHV